MPRASRASRFQRFKKIAAWHSKNKHKSTPQQVDGVNRSDEMLKQFFAGDFPTRLVVARTESGQELTAGELPRYSEALVTFHTEPVDASTLSLHVMLPRAPMNQPTGPVSWEHAAQLLESFVKDLGKSLGLPVFRVPFQPSVLVLGHIPNSNNVGYHGTHAGSVYNIFKHMLQPKTCKRRCAAREEFGPRIFLCSAYPVASGWSQYVDVGYLQHCRKETSLAQPHFHDAAFWYTNAVCVFDYDSQYLATSLSVANVANAAARPRMCMFELRSETELFQSGRRISPHIGEFY